MRKATERKKRRGKDRFEPRKTYVKGELYWQVNLPSEDGRRKRKTYRDHQEAETAAEQARIKAKNEGLSAFAISSQLRTDALAAERLLKPFDVSITEAAKFYAEHLRKVRTSQKVSIVVKELLVAREHDNLRPRYLKDLRVRLNRFSASFGERPIADISAGEINGWLRGFKPFNRNTFRLRISTLFSYAIERGWCTSNPVADVKKVKASASIGILSPEEFAKVLEAASEETLPYWLLGGFAGLRRAEIERLEWKDIHFDLAKYRAFTAALVSGDKAAIAKCEKEWRVSALIEVPALKAKTASRRFVQLQDNLAAWLEPYISRAGNVCPPNLRTLLEIDRVNAGLWIAPEGAVKAAGKVSTIERANIKLKRWPSNGLRHSFASYHLAYFGDAARLALELGHTDQELLFRHYRELVKPDAAAKYWNIRPAPQTNWLPSPHRMKTDKIMIQDSTGNLKAARPWSKNPKTRKQQRQQAHYERIMRAHQQNGGDGA
jgi:integrase